MKHRKNLIILHRNQSKNFSLALLLDYINFKRRTNYFRKIYPERWKNIGKLHCIALHLINLFHFCGVVRSKAVFNDPNKSLSSISLLSVITARPVELSHKLKHCNQLELSKQTACTLYTILLSN